MFTLIACRSDAVALLPMTLPSGAADACLVIRFDRARSAQPVDAFVEQPLLGGLGMRALVVGGNFACGHQRKEDVAYLVHAGLRHGFTVKPVALRQAAEAAATRRAPRPTPGSWYRPATWSLPAPCWDVRTNWPAPLWPCRQVMRWQ